ncbi:MAG: glycosyltransferase [Fidelibacterota bacterium]
METACSIAVIAWTQVSRRSQELARELGAVYYRLDRVDRPNWKIVYCLVRNFIKTFLWLCYYQPDVVITFHAHPFVTLSGSIYAWLFSKKVIPDIHTAGFLDYDFFPVQQISNFLWKRSFLILLHNPEAGKYIGEKYPDLVDKIFVLEDPLPQIEVAVPKKENDKPICTFICRYSNDEPFREFLEAVKSIPDVDFYITGNVEKNPTLKSKYNQKNIHFTGFLSDIDYFKQLAKSDLLIALTTRPYTLMSAGYEALEIGKPLIVTDSEALRQYFLDNVLYSDNNVDSIRDSLTSAIRMLPDLAEKMNSYKQVKLNQWQNRVEELLMRIEKI